MHATCRVRIQKRYGPQNLCPLLSSSLNELIYHKQIVHETMENFTNVGNKNLMTVTHTQNFKHHIVGKIPRKKPTKGKLV